MSVVIFESMNRKILLKYFDNILKKKPIENSIPLNNFRQLNFVFSQEEKFKLMFIKDNIFIFVLIFNCSTKIFTYSEEILTKKYPPPFKKRKVLSLLFINEKHDLLSLEIGC